MSNVNNTKKKTQTKKTAPATNTPSKDVHLGDGVLDAAKATANERASDLAVTLTHMLFDYFVGAVKDLPETIKNWLANPETEKEVAALLSHQLYEQGVIPEGYSGLPTDLLIHNFHQDGYLDGMYAGYLISMIALEESGISKDVLLAARKTIMPRFFKKSYEDRKELFEELEGEMRKWKENPDVEETEKND